MTKLILTHCLMVIHCPNKIQEIDPIILRVNYFMLDSKECQKLLKYKESKYNGYNENIRSPLKKPYKNISTISNVNI